MGAGFLVFLFFWGGGMLSLREIGKPALVSRDFKLLSDHGDKKKCFEPFWKQSWDGRMSSIYLTVVNIQKKKRETRKPSSTRCVFFSLCRMIYPHSSTGANSLWLSTRGTFWLIFKALPICPPLLPTGNNSNRQLHSQPKVILVYTALLEKGYLHGGDEGSMFLISTPA